MEASSAIAFCGSAVRVETRRSDGSERITHTSQAHSRSRHNSCPAALPVKARAQSPAASTPLGLSTETLPAGIRSRFVNNVNGLRMHVLEAGSRTRVAPRCCSFTVTRSSPSAGEK
jgi:hypothetical protein